MRDITGQGGYVREDQVKVHGVSQWSTRHTMCLCLNLLILIIVLYVCLNYLTSINNLSLPSEEFQYLVKHTVLHSQIPFDYGT